MWSITPLQPTLQQVVGAGADTRTKREEYISEIGKVEVEKRLEHRRDGKRVEYLLVYFSSTLFRLSESFLYQTLRHIMVTAAFFTIAFAVNGSVNTEAEARLLDSFNFAIDSCFIADGIVKAISVYSLAKRLETYDMLNSRMFMSSDNPAGEEMVAKKYTLSKIFKHCGFVDCFIALFCLVFNGEVVADWFRLVRIVIISIWALENEPRIAILLSGIVHGFRSMRSLLMLMLLINVIFASIAITTFGENDPYNFGSMPVAMWSFFEMSTMEGWSTILNINRKGCDSVPDSDYEMFTNETTRSIVRYGGEFYMPVCVHPEKQPYLSTVIFLAYMIIVGFILTSITIGAISTGINERFDVLRSQQLSLELEQVKQDEQEKEEGNEKDKEQEHGNGRVRETPKTDEHKKSSRGKNVHFSTDCDDDSPNCVNHHEIYHEEESLSFSNNALALNDMNNEQFSEENLNREIVNFSDLSVEQQPSSISANFARMSAAGDLKKTNLFVPPSLRPKGTSYQLDQFSFRTCNDGEGEKEHDEKYDIFVTELQECLDIIKLERDVNGDRKLQFIERRTASNTYLRGQLTKTATGLKRSDLRFNEMKSKDFHILMYKFKSFVYGDAYGLVVLMFILLAALFEIVTLSNPNENFQSGSSSVYKIQLCIQLVFTIDVLLHFLAMFPRYHQFLLFQWNLFDFVIVMALWLPFMMDILEKYIRLLRVLRLVALIKFMKWVPQLAYILDAITSSVRLLLYTVLLMGMCFYYFAVAGVLLFKENDPEHFGKLHTSFLSMVSVATFDNWALICRTNMYGCDMLGYNTGVDEYDAQCTSPLGRGWWASLYFFVFIIVENYILINLLISIIMTSMDISYKNSKEVDKMWLRISQKKKKFNLSNLLMKKILAVFVILDFNTSCAISLSAATPFFEYMSVTEHSEVISIFNQVDEDKLGSIDFPEFIEMMFFLEKRSREGKAKGGDTAKDSKL